MRDGGRRRTPVSHSGDVEVGQLIDLGVLKNKYWQNINIDFIKLISISTIKHCDIKLLGIVVLTHLHNQPKGRTLKSKTYMTKLKRS